MKEIDFLPDWYKSGKRRQTSRRLQYALLTCTLVVMVLWNLHAGYNISQARADLEKKKQENLNTKDVKQQYHNLKSEVTQLQKKADFLDKLHSRIQVTNILGEISFLTDNKIVLTELRFQAEKIRNITQNDSGYTVRVAGSNASGNNSLPLGQMRFKVIIKGIAADAGEVADLVFKLEKSPYFRDISSSLKNRKIKNKTALMKKPIQVSEFQIECFLANYRLESPVSEKR